MTRRKGARLAPISSPYNCDAAKARAIIGYLARKLDAASLTDVAAYFQRDVSTLSRQVGEIEKQATSLLEMKGRMKKFIEATMQAYPAYICPTKN